MKQNLNDIKLVSLKDIFIGAIIYGIPYFKSL